MSYNLLRVNDNKPIDGNVDVTLSSSLSASASAGEIPLLNGSWGSMIPSASPPLGLSYSQHANGASFGVSTYNYSGTLWAYEYNSRSVIFKDGSVSEVNAVSPPAPVTTSNWRMAVTLPAGTYFIRAVPSFTTGWAVCRLYHTTTSNTSGVYFGNSTYINTADGKTGSTLMGVVTLTTTRRIFIRLTSESTSIHGASAFFCGSWQIRKIG